MPHEDEQLVAGIDDDCIAQMATLGVGWLELEQTVELALKFARFEHEGDARRFWDAMRERLQEFSLSLYPEKTRLIEFDRFAADWRARRGVGKPETFTFLGFVLCVAHRVAGSFSFRGKPGATECV